MAQCSLNNSSIHPTYFLPTRQKAKTLLIHVPGRLKANKVQRRSTMRNTINTTIHHSMLCYYCRHTTDFIGQNTRGRSPHASLDINTTSNYCPVSLARVARLVERRTPDSEAPGSNPTNTQLFFWVHLLKVCSIQPKKPFKKRKKKTKNSIWVPILKVTATKNSVDEPSKVTIKFEGRPPCRVSLQVQF